MRFFFKSKKFKVISIISVFLVITIVVCGCLTGWSAPQSNIISSVFSPVQNFASGVSSSVSSFFGGFSSKKELQDKIKQLEEELAEKNYDLVDYEDVVRQNDFYKDFLEIKEDNPSYDFTASRVIARDVNDSFMTFTIDKGTLDGVSVYDPVITAEGLVGYISDAYSTQSTVMTILNPNINVSAIDNHSRDSGNITGDNELSTNGQCKMTYISSDNTMASGNFIVTSGAGGIFPAGQLVGSVVEIKSSDNKISCEAVIQPIVDLDSVADVMVITNFSGKDLTK